MGRPVTQERAVAPASQFTGSEFSVAPPSAAPGAFLRLKELNLKMGTESKTWRIEKVSAAGNVMRMIISWATCTDCFTGAMANLT